MSVTVDGLLSDGHASELKAMSKYHDTRVLISGTVESVGVRKVEEVVAEEDGWMVSGFYSGSLRASKRRVPYPFVRLAGRQKGVADRAVCYFWPYQGERVSTLKEGAVVTLECDFQEYDVKTDRWDVILKKCIVRSP
jgi:nucleoside-triphosphatase THEP1